MYEAVYKFYLGDYYRIGMVVPSPLPEKIRPKDDKPSFSTRRYNDSVIWKDFGYHSPYGNGPIGLVRLMEPDINSVEEAREFIKSVILKGKKVTRHKTINDIFEIVGSIKEDLNFQYYFLEPEHYMYYKQLAVGPEILHFYKMFALKAILKNDKPFWRETPDLIGFYKKIGKGNKGYMPYNYFHSGVPKVIHQGIDILEGYDELPRTGKMLIWAKSLKEVILLRSCGYYAVSLSGENSFSIFNLYYWELSERFEIHVSWGDPDPTGIRMSRYIKSHIPKTKIAESRIAKDASDIYIKMQSRFYIHLIIDYALQYG